MKKLLITATVFFMFLQLSVTFSQSSSTGEISGRVIEKQTQKPLPGITVILVGTQLGAISSQNGAFRIKDVSPGIYALRFSGVGYETFIVSDLLVSTVKPANVEVELIQKVIELKGAEVKAAFFVKKAETVTSTQSFNAEDIRRAPGVQEDVVRATSLLPGVGVTQAGRNDIAVRGGAPFENLYIVDDIEVPNINHFGSQGSTGGPLSMIDIDFVRNVEFSSGGFGARYGDKLSSMTNISLRKGNEDKYGGKLTLSASQFGANFEGPISDKGSFWVSVRRSYLDLLFGLAGFAFIPEYWDFHTKADYRLDRNNSLSFLTIGALNTVKLNNDDLDQKYNNSRIAVPNQDQYFTGLTWQTLFDKGFGRITLGRSYVNFNTFQNDSLLNNVLKNNSKEAEISLKTNFEFKIFEKSDIQFGNTVKYASMLDYDLFIDGLYRRDAEGNFQTLQIDTSLLSYKNSTYASYTTLLGRYKITAGGRLDYFSITEQNWFLSPRLSMIYSINDVSNIILSAGRYYQSPSYIWLLGSENNKLSPLKADQLVLGYEHTPLIDVKVQLEVYYKLYDNYPARLWRPQAVLSPAGFDDIANDIPFGLEPLVMQGQGRSKGVELFIQKKMSEIPLYGLLTLSMSETEFKSIEGNYRPGSFDTRFIMNLAAGYRFNHLWEVSGKFRFATGLPTTPYLRSGMLDYSQYNEGERLPDFHSLDVRVDKRWEFTNFYLITYIDIQNVYARKNVSGVRWDYRDMKERYSESLGILPSLGISLEF